MIGWYQGNLGYRRAQLRGSKVLALGDGSLKTELALARNIGKDIDTAGNDDGEDSAMPEIQGRIGYALPIVGKKKFDIGLGGFHGWREIDGVNSDRYKPYAVCLDVTCPLPAGFSLVGEAYAGQGLGEHMGNIATSYTAGNVVKGKGAFLNLIYKLDDRWTFMAGYGLDDPDNDDLGATSAANNRSLFGNVRYRFYKTATVGFELDRMETDYMNRADRVNYRTQVTFCMKF